MIVRLALEPGARRRRAAPWTWRAVLSCPAASERFRGRAVWIGPSVYQSREAALQGAVIMLAWIERQTWMGG